MFTMNTKIVVPFADLRYLSVKCSSCNSDLTLDMAYHPQPSPTESAVMPMTPNEPLKIVNCPTCSGKFDSRVPDIIDSFRKMYRHMIGHNVDISFRVDAA